jgi:hypothetical protein
LVVDGSRPPRRDEALVAADDGAVLTAGQDGLDEPELAEAALEGVEIVVADPARVGGIGSELVDRDLLDDEVGQGRSDHAVSSLARAGDALIRRSPGDWWVTEGLSLSPRPDLRSSRTFAVRLFVVDEVVSRASRPG